jgi:hypothetical protein
MAYWHQHLYVIKNVETRFRQKCCAILMIVILADLYPSDQNPTGLNTDNGYVREGVKSRTMTRLYKSATQVCLIEVPHPVTHKNKHLFEAKCVKTIPRFTLEKQQRSIRDCCCSS